MILLCKFLYILIQWTWGFLQSLLGLIFLVLLGKQERTWYGCALMTVYDQKRVRLNRIGSVSLGMFTFVIAKKDGKPHPGLAAHEYGHTFQSLILGPLYLIVVGIPSFLWALQFSRHRKEYGEKGVAYTSRYPENWAENWGGRIAAYSARKAD